MAPPKGKEIGCQVEAKEAAGRFGTERGTQLDKGVIIEAFIIRPPDDSPAQLKIMAHFFEILGSGEFIKGVEAVFHPNLALLRQEALIYTHPEVFDKASRATKDCECPQIPCKLRSGECAKDKMEANLKKLAPTCRIGQEAEAKAIAVTAARLGNEQNRALHRLDMALIFDIFALGVKLSEELLKKLLQKLVADRILTSPQKDYLLGLVGKPDADCKNYKFCTILQKILPQMQLVCGKLSCKWTPGTTATTDDDDDECGGFFKNVDAMTDIDRYKHDFKMNSNMAKLLATGGQDRPLEHYYLERGEHPFANLLLLEVAEDYMAVRAFAAQMGREDQSMASTADQDVLKTTADDVNMKSVGARTEGLSNLQSIRTRVSTRDAAEQQDRYKTLAESLKKDPNFTNDPQKAKALALVEEAVKNKRELTQTELESILAAMNTQFALPPAMIPKLIDRLIEQEILLPEHRRFVEGEVQKLQQAGKTIKINDLHDIVAKKR